MLPARQGVKLEQEDSSQKNETSRTTSLVLLPASFLKATSCFCCRLFNEFFISLAYFFWTKKVSLQLWPALAVFSPVLKPSPCRSHSLSLCWLKCLLLEERIKTCRAAARFRVDALSVIIRAITLMEAPRRCCINVGLLAAAGGL